MTNPVEDYLLPISRQLTFDVPSIDYHFHTSWTDGLHSVQEMYDSACDLRLECILFSEHASRSSEAWYLKFAEEVLALPKEPCLPLLGVEARVMDFEGNLGVPDDILSLCDLIVGSVHRFPDLHGKPIPFEEVQPEKAMEMEFRLADALLDNGAVHILGHPFGMCHTRFALTPSEDLVLYLMEKAANRGIAFEVNSKYHPKPWEYIRQCRSACAMISLGSDAHSREELGTIVQVLRDEKE